MNEIDIRMAPEDFEHSSKNVFIGKDVFSGYLKYAELIQRLIEVDTNIRE